VNPNKLITREIKFPTFDCRVGACDTEEEAVSFLLWRANDCGINAMLDAMHQFEGPNFRKSIPECIVWLKENDKLPLSTHQRGGTFSVKRKIIRDGVNGKTGERC